MECSARSYIDQTMYRRKTPTSHRLANLVLLNCYQPCLVYYARIKEYFVYLHCTVGMPWK